ncbi:MAG: hypothetical protein PHO02_06520 [Candidatus Nanoarchaeia archaeon]|nr:hypothetical protein [Candidatus Nanoarchaeia archaeon]
MWLNYEDTNKLHMSLGVAFLVLAAILFSINSNLMYDFLGKLEQNVNENVYVITQSNLDTLEHAEENLFENYKLSLESNNSVYTRSVINMSLEIMKTRLEILDVRNKILQNVTDLSVESKSSIFTGNMAMIIILIITGLFFFIWGYVPFRRKF